MSNDEPIKVGKYIITSALYGANDKYVSAMHLIRKAVDGFFINLNNDTVGCDPIKKVKKKLKITYKTDKEDGVIYFKEHENIILQMIKNYKRKIFIDAGCFTGDTISEFLCQTGWYNKLYPKTDSDIYEIFAFDGFEYKEEWEKLLFIKPDIKFYNKIVGVRNETVTFYNNKYNQGNSILNWQKNTKKEETLVECISLPEFIVSNFNKDDYIILKLDVEGSEFEILEKMIEDKSITYINELYVEFHTFAEKKNGHRKELYDTIRGMGIFINIWP